MATEQFTALDSAVATVKQAMTGNNPQPLRQALDALALATQPLAEALMNAVVSQALRDKKPDELTPEIVD